MKRPRSVFFFIFVFYALLSLAAPHLQPIRAFEATGLIFYRPWDGLRELLGFNWPDPHSSSDPWAQEKSNPPALADQDPMRWWSPVFETPASMGAFSLSGAQSVGSISAHATRIRYHAGPGIPIQSGDPVLFGDQLVGFVGEDLSAGSFDVVLLNHPASRTVVGAVRGTVAGSEILFFVGGASSDREGEIRVRFPSSLFGLRTGCLAHTVAESLTPDIPADLRLGTVDLGPAGKGKVALVPACEPPALSRVAVAVPMARTGGVKRVQIPERKGEKVRVRATPFAVTSQGNLLSHVTAGLEEGLRERDLLVIKDRIVGQLCRVGFFSSAASPLLVPGREMAVALFPEEGSALFFKIKALHQEGLVFQVQADRHLGDLEPGTPLYIDEKPGLGFSDYPAFHIVSGGEGQELRIRIPWSGEGGKIFCLRAPGVM